MEPRAMYDWLSKCHAQVGTLLRERRLPEAGMLSNLFGLVARGRHREAANLARLLQAASGSVHDQTTLLIEQARALLASGRGDT